MLPTSTLDGILLIKKQVVETASTHIGYEPSYRTEVLELSQVNAYSSSQQLHFEMVYQHMKTMENKIVSNMTETILTCILWHYHSLAYISK